MVYEPPVEKPIWQRMKCSRRAIAYGILLSLIFMLTCIELGLVSQQLHEHGNSYAHYPTQQYKHVLGLLLFSTIITLVFTLTHFWAGIGVIPFLSLILGLFWGIGAGLLRTGTPFRGTSCTSKAALHYPPAFRPYASQCKRVVTIEGIAWIQWAFFIILLIGSLVHKLRISTRPTPEGMYFAVPEKSEV